MTSSDDNHQFVFRVREYRFSDAENTLTVLRLCDEPCSIKRGCFETTPLSRQRATCLLTSIRAFILLFFCLFGLSRHP